MAASAFADSPPSKPATSTPVTPTPTPTPLPLAQIPSPVVMPLTARSRTPGNVPRWKFNEYSVIAGSCILLLVVIFGLTRLLTNKPSSLQEATQRARTESQSPQQSPESVTPEPPKSAPQSSAARVFTDLPPGGSIKLDGVELGKSSGAEIVGNLQVGKRLLEIDARPLGNASFRFAVNDQGAPLFPEQSPITGLKALVVSTGADKTHAATTLPSASIRIDSLPVESVGNVPKELAALTADKHQIAFIDGDQVLERTIEIGKTPSLIIFVTHDYGSLEVTSNAEGARVRVDQRSEKTIENGKAYFHRLRLGDHVVSVGADEYLPVGATTVAIAKGKKFVHHVSLAPKPKFSTLRIQGAPVDAQVSIEGKTVGTIRQDGVLTDDRVEPGTHSVEIAKAGFKKYQTQRAFKAGETITVEAQLEKLPGKLDVRIAPANARATIRSLPDGTARPLKSGVTELAEGRYCGCRS